jgi:hypothetical protein
MIEITAIRLQGGNSHDHVTDVRWRSAGQSTLEAIVARLSASQDNHAVVADGPDRVAVAVVLPSGEPRYIRACVDGAWTDHLVTLTRF